ncbi:MAG TPA: ABC transporter permease [Gemmatimonadaceae bacterium]|nr:ABC transporter permease [Gemmatimonadaceae bacterium]
MQSRQLWQSFRRDLTVALRQARKDRTITVVALATFALGIGANAAMFSVVRSVLLRPLPYAQPERLAAIWPTRTISNAELLYMQRQAKAFESVAAFSPGWGIAMTGAGEPRQLDAARVSTNFFDVLGVRPLLGRGFASEESSSGRWNVAVLSHALWLSQFGGDSAVLGRVVDMDGQPVRIVGVMPANFEMFQASVDAWLPLQIDPASPFYTGATALGFGRLRRGATTSQATREFATLAPRMRVAFNYTDDYARGATVVDLHESLVGGVRRTILVLYAAVAILGLIAVVNVGNLLLAHAAGRRREMAVRRALGAAKSAIVRQLLVQSVVLAVAGGVIGATVGVVGTQALRTFLATSLPRMGEIHLDLVVAAATAIATVIAGITFGIGPALVASGVDPDGVLRASALDAGGNRAARIRQTLVVVQVSLATVLVVAASLMVVSLWRLGRVDLGFDPSRVATMLIQPSSGQVRAADATNYFDELARRIAALPDVERVGAAQHLPLSGFNWLADLEIEGQPIAPTSAHPRVIWRSVIGDYFGAMRIPLVRGRLFLPADTRNGPAVVVVNAAMARRYWPGRDPIGERIKLGNGSRGEWATIVGIVGDVRSQSADSPAPAEAYRPNAQQPLVFMHYVIRTRGNPLGAMARVRAAVRSLDQTVPIAQVRSLEEIASTSSVTRRTIARLLAGFAGLGLFLGAVGIYGVIAYSVRRRTRELGIRSALGAVESRLTAMVLGEGLRMSSAGIALGVVLAALATRPMRALLFGVTALDPLVYVGVALTLAGVAIAASLAPARRAARVDPIIALRSE